MWYHSSVIRASETKHPKKNQNVESGGRSSLQRDTIPRWFCQSQSRRSILIILVGRLIASPTYMCTPSRLFSVPVWHFDLLLYRSNDFEPKVSFSECCLPPCVYVLGVSFCATFFLAVVCIYTKQNRKKNENNKTKSWLTRRLLKHNLILHLWY